MITLTESDVRRFWSYVSKSDGCWEWTGDFGRKGYGRLFVARRRPSAHRCSWQIHVGEIPVGLCVLHRCDNPSCVRPDHLFLGTLADNNRDRAQKGRSACGERNGTHTCPDSRPYGERNGASKLTLSQVGDIRCSLDGTASISELSRRFGVDRVVIRGIRDGSRWAKAGKP